MYQTIWQGDELHSSPVLEYVINATGCKIKVQNTSRYAIDVYVGSSQEDRIEPYSYAVLPNGDYTLKLNRNIVSKNVQEYEFVSFKTLDSDTDIGSTTFTGTMNVEGDVNITNSQLDVQVLNDVNVNVNNSELNVTGNVDANITGGSVEISGGTVQAEIVSGTVNAVIENAQIQTELMNSSLAVNDLCFIGEYHDNNFQYQLNVPKTIQVEINQNFLKAFNYYYVKIESVGMLKGQQDAPIFAIAPNVNFVGMKNSLGYPVPAFSNDVQPTVESSLLYKGLSTTVIKTSSPSVPDFLKFDIIASSDTNENGVLQNVQIKVSVYGMLDFKRIKEGSDGILNTLTLLGSNRYFTQGHYAIDVNNSDIVGVNGIVLGDYAQSDGEGILFPKSTAPPKSNNLADYECFRALDGILYFNGEPVILAGYDSITPVANQPTTTRVYFRVPFKNPPVVNITANTTLPETGVREISVGVVTNTYFDVWIYRTTNVTTNFHWIATPRTNGVG